MKLETFTQRKAEERNLPAEEESAPEEESSAEEKEKPESVEEKIETKEHKPIEEKLAANEKKEEIAKEEEKVEAIAEKLKVSKILLCRSCKINVFFVLLGTGRRSSTSCAERRFARKVETRRADGKCSSIAGKGK